MVRSVRVTSVGFSTTDMKADTGFSATVGKIGVVLTVLSLLLNLAFLLLICAIVYFFLAAMGLVPPADVVPVLPYI